jgi:hypothetical protein
LDQQSGVTSLTTPAPSATATSQLAVVEEARLSCQTQLQLPDMAGVPKIFIFLSNNLVWSLIFRLTRARLHRIEGFKHD